MLTPKNYWRIASSLDVLQTAPPREFLLPTCLSTQKYPPAIGDGLVLANYDAEERTGLIRQLGIVTGLSNASVQVDWRPIQAQIWVDSSAGVANWKNKEGFGFADTKVAGYRLHQLFADHFEGLEVREAVPAEINPSGSRGRTRHTKGVLADRTIPMEIVGKATPTPRGGYVYVLRSALGSKVGRTRNIPNRMRPFGIKLPIAYTIPLCAWFDDCVDAESRYHRLFASKHINGEWFDLVETDVELIRRRVFQ